MTPELALCEQEAEADGPSRLPIARSSARLRAVDEPHRSRSIHPSRTSKRTSWRSFPVIKLPSGPAGISSSRPRVATVQERSQQRGAGCGEEYAR